MLAPIRLRWGERAFVLWAGLKGAVPILLGMFILTAAVTGATRIYAIIFIVVLVSVLLQGGLVPLFARLFRVPMQSVELEPWASGLRFNRRTGRSAPTHHRRRLRCRRCHRAWSRTRRVRLGQHDQP